MSLTLRPFAPPQRRLDGLSNPSQRRPEADRAALLIHGFTGTPYELSSLVGPLATRGWSVEVPALPGHGTHPRELDGVRMEDWRQFVAGRYRALRAAHRRVAVVGLSMGGVLARGLLDEPTPPDAVVSLAAPWRLADRAARILLPWLRRSGAARALVWVKDGGSDLLDEAAAPEPVNYRWTPLSAVAELDRLLARARRRRPEGRVPALVLHGRHDRTALPADAWRVLRALGPAAAGWWLDDSAHVVTRDRQREAVAEAVAGFLDEGRTPAGWSPILPGGAGRGA